MEQIWENWEDFYSQEKNLKPRPKLQEDLRFVEKKIKP